MYDDDLADIYDDLYTAGLGKDYRREAADIAALVRDRAPDAASLLDVGCGTGQHLTAFADLFTTVEGVEPSAAMRARAAGRDPRLVVHDGDMRDLHLGHTFDVVTCLFSAIGYAVTPPELHAAAASLARHTNPGGTVVIDPWFTPEQWTDDHIGHVVAQTSQRTVIRMSRATAHGRVSQMLMHYLVADHSAPGEIRHFTDTHTLGLHTEDEYRDAMAAAGLTDIAAVDGWAPGRGRLIGTR